MEYGIVVGIVWALIKIGSMGTAGPTWIYKHLRSNEPTTANRAARRLSRILSPWSRLASLRVFAPLRSMAFLGLFWYAIDADYLLPGFVPGVVLSYIGVAGLGILMGIFHKYRVQTEAFAAREAAHRLPPFLANELLIPYAQQTKGSYRLGAIHALEALGTPEAIALLQQFSREPDADMVREALKSLTHLEGLADGRRKALPVQNMERLTLKHRHLLKFLSKNVVSKEQANYAQEMKEIIGELDEIVDSQLPLRRRFPAVFCQDCYTRGERHTYEGWDWIICSNCHQTQAMHAGVERVIGVIGADAEWGLKEGVLRVNLWDNIHHKARLAEMESLEIVGGKAIQYDWAVSALVDLLHKHSTTATVHVPMRLVGAPPLEANSLRLLETLKAGPVVVV